MKEQWIDKFNIEEVERALLQTPLKSKIKWNKDCMMMAIGETYYRFAVISILTMANYTDIPLNNLHLFVDENIINNHCKVIDHLSRYGVTIVNASEYMINLECGHFPQYNFLLTYPFQKDVLMIDADIVFHSPLEFGMRRDMSNNLVLTVPDMKGRERFTSLTVYERYEWSRRDGYRGNFGQFLHDIHDFVKRYNDISYEDFEEKILYSPEYYWPNASMVHIPLRILQNDQFKYLCYFVFCQLKNISDELVYHIYCNFFNEHMYSFEDFDFNIRYEKRLTPEQDWMHIHCFHDDESVQKVLETLLYINNRCTYLNVCHSKSLKQYEFIYDRDYSIRILDVVVESMCKGDVEYFSDQLRISAFKNDEGYYLTYTFLDGRYKEMFMFKKCPPLINLEYSVHGSYIQIVGSLIDTEDVVFNHCITKCLMNC